MRLDSLNAFSFPFGAKTLGLLSLALRTIALVAIVPVVFVSDRAVRLLGVDVGRRCRVAFGIFAGRNGVQVLWVNASTIAARVIHYVANWDRTIRQINGDAMRSAKGSPEIKDPVSVSIFPTRPCRTSAVRSGRYVDVEARNLGIGCIAHMESNQVVCRACMVCIVRSAA